MYIYRGGKNSLKKIINLYINNVKRINLKIFLQQLKTMAILQIAFSFPKNYNNQLCKWTIQKEVC